MSLAILRINKGYTASEAANRLNISQGHYSHLENGTRTISDELAQNMAELFEVSKEVILQKSKELIEQRGTLQHWLSKTRYRGESLVDKVIKELRYDRRINLDDKEELIYKIASRASEFMREEIIWDFNNNPDLIEYFRKKLKE
ncbi:MAG: helix-turn-helix transcriptional regulator [Syntrophothermus sp.]